MADPSGPRAPWNVIVTARGEGVSRARRALRALGRVERTGFYNVLAMCVDEPAQFVERVEQLAADERDVAESLASVFPAECCFEFASVAEFEAKARELTHAWVPRLAGKSFHVRLHRRGRKGTLVSPDEERALADVLLAAAQETGNPARVAFDDPDAIVLIETIGGRAGMALLTRDDFRRHPLLAAH